VCPFSRPSICFTSECCDRVRGEVGEGVLDPVALSAGSAPRRARSVSTRGRASRRGRARRRRVGPTPFRVVAIQLVGRPPAAAGLAVFALDEVKQLVVVECRAAGSAYDNRASRVSSGLRRLYSSAEAVVYTRSVSCGASSLSAAGRTIDERPRFVTRTRFRVTESVRTSSCLVSQLDQQSCRGDRTLACGRVS